MTIILFLIPVSILIAAGFLMAFIWAVRSGQFDDTGTPPLRLLMDDPNPIKENPTTPLNKENER